MNTPTPSEKQVPKDSFELTSGGILAFLGGLTFVIAFASPYWLVSYDQAFSQFKKMGLWEQCFEDFRYPYYQFDKKFNGCYYVFSDEYRIVRERLLPGWLITVQALMSVAVIPSFLSQVLVSLVVMKFPLNLMRYKWMFIATAALCAYLTVPLILLAVFVFCASVWDRDWLPMNPLWNHLSWSFGFACVSVLFHSFAGHQLRKYLLTYVQSWALSLAIGGLKCITLETGKSRDAYKRDQNLVMQMHSPGYNGYM